MKKYIFGTVFCGILLLTACQATPKTDVIHMREQDQYTAETLEESENAAVLREVPARWTEQIQAYDGKVTLNIDAEIEVPEREKWPVYRTRLAAFSQDEMQQYTRKLCGADVPLKEKKIIETKADQLRSIQDYTKIIEEIENGSDAYEGGVEHFQELIEQALATAPEQAEYADFTWDAEENDFQFFAQRGDAENPWIWFENNLGWGSYFAYADTGMKSMENALWCDDYSDVFSSDDYKIVIQKDTATATREAEEFIKELGIEGMAPEGAVKMFGVSTKDLFTYDVCAHGIVFTRLYNDIPAVYAPEKGVLTEVTTTGGEEYAVSRAAEHLIVVVDEEGVAQLRWASPEKITEVENENVRLVEFSKMQQAMETALKVRYAYIGENQEKMNAEDFAAQEDVTVNVSKICLRYASIHIPSNPDEFRAVPAWVFYNDKGEVLLEINATDMSNI